jgi:hypothetical protein
MFSGPKKLTAKAQRTPSYAKEDKILFTSFRKLVFFAILCVLCAFAVNLASQ